jgi:hypothetical protein
MIKPVQVPAKHETAGNSKNVRAEGGKAHLCFALHGMHLLLDAMIKAVQVPAAETRAAPDDIGYRYCYADRTETTVARVCGLRL